MAVDFQTSNITIPSGTGRRSIESFVTFGSTVLRASVALNGFNLAYGDDLDRHLNVVEADTDFIRIVGNTVRFRVQCNLADKNSDDPYSGVVNALVIAEVA